MPMPFLSVRTASCLATLVCALAAFTLAARAQDPALASATPAHAQSAPSACPKPVYPPEAKQAHWTGVSTVAFLIDVDGGVRDTRVLKSSGHAVLDEAVLATLKACAFTPSTKNGHRVEAWQPVQFVWTLD